MGLVRTAGAQQLEPVATTALPGAQSYRQIPGAEPSQRVPVLFSTNRGLYLRQVQAAEQMERRVQGYDISFCDLERWSTNRANVISLEDTFNITQQNSTPQCCAIRCQPRGCTGYRSNYNHFGN